MTRTVLVVAPMPTHPTSAGNRRRLLLTCEWLMRAGFAVDLAYVAHEDQVYRRHGRHPPTDFPAMTATFRRTFLIEANAAIPLRCRARAFGIDDWCPEALDGFVAWFVAAFPDTGAVLVNYVFLSRCLEAVPPGVLRLIDTHDRFADRQRQYRPFRAEPSFFHTDRAGEAAGLDRADIVLAIQSEEAAYFRGATRKPVHLLPPRFPAKRGFEAPHRIARIGFLGHGNDPNLFSIRAFAEAWAADWTPGLPELLVAGEICASLGGVRAPGVRLLGYVATLETFYDQVDLVVAPMLMGSGLKMKVAEALSFGVPVVGTALGFEGFAPQAAAHRCADVAQIKATLLALHADARGLGTLTQDCTALFARYNAEAREAEAALAALIRERSHPGRPAHDAAPARAEAPLALAAGAVALERVRRLPTAALDDPAHGRLVATERLTEAEAQAIGYAPERRHWFARATPGAADGGSRAQIGARRVALSPEWVRERRLPASVREALALAFVDMIPDWTAQGRRVGESRERMTVATILPSFLLTGSRAAAAFLVDPDSGRSCELAVETLAPLSLAPESRFTAARPDLTPVPAAATFGHAQAGPLPSRGRILFLTDDLVGRIDLGVPPDAARGGA